ncbi:hypothetical protein [Streptomyces sp. NPDC056987]|uniref:hypothetical protein n=1 Tax=Streptomyces sp. NPDC056987 TaxID=3345988 RepID=UPI00363E5314
MNDLRNYSVDETADLLGCKPRYLEDNLKILPHQKIGIAVVFDASEILAIKEMHRVRPGQFAPRAPEPLAESGTSALSLATIRPKRRA